MQQNLKLAVIHNTDYLSHNPYISVTPKVKGVSQNINYTTIALLPVLTSLFDHIAQHQFGDDVICKSEYTF